jgi:uncharacterized protein (DUF302 family)
VSEIVIKSSGYAYLETIAHLKAAISAAGGTLFAEIDQSAAAESIGLHLRPTTLLIFGNPKGGTPLMDAFPTIALDLPLKLAIWEENGVHIAYATMSALAQRHRVTGNEALVAGLDRALEVLIASVA